MEKSSAAANRKPFGKPSDRLTQVKTTDPFATSTKKQKTNFGHAYNSGSMPFRIEHGCSYNKIRWDIPPDTIDSFDPILINCFEGLLETDHPFKFLAFEALKEMLDSQNAGQKTVPLLQRLVQPLRAALRALSEPSGSSLRSLSEPSERPFRALSEPSESILRAILRALSDASVAILAQAALRALWLARDRNRRFRKRHIF